jgi:hypothetical protein
MTSALAWARFYRDKGWAVIPLLKQSKKPAIPWKEYQERHPRVREIEAKIQSGS